MASSCGFNDIVELLLGAGADINLKDLQKHTALNYATLSGYKDTVKLLLHRKADLNASLTNPLHIACTSTNTELIALLLHAKSSVYTLNAKQQTPLSIATTMSNPQCVELLIKHHALVGSNEHLLHMVAYRGDPIEMSDVLLRNGVNINQ